MKRYKTQRGRPSKLEYDFLVFDQGKLCFRGEFIARRKRNLTADERQIIRAMRIAIEALNHEQ